MSTTRAEVVRTPSRQTLAELPARVVVFLAGIGTHAAIRAVLAEGGYGPEDHEEGWALLGRACAYGSSGVDPHAELPQRQAMSEIASWVGTHFPRLRAALERLHPEQLTLFAGIETPSDPASALLGLALFLRRLDALDAAGSEAVHTLNRRGVDRPERDRLAALVATASAAPKPASGGAVRDRREAELVQLWRWWSDWSATARVLVGRKDWLCTLGLHARRRPARGAE